MKNKNRVQSFPARPASIVAVLLAAMISGMAQPANPDKRNQYGLWNAKDT